MLQNSRPASAGPLEPEKAGSPAADAQLTAAAGQQLFRLGRLFSRYPLKSRIKAAAADREPELSQILLTQILHARECDGSAPSVGEIARELGVDPSTASRLTRQAQAAGWIERRADDFDARASRFHLTDAGRVLAVQALLWQEETFLRLTADWPVSERLWFADRFLRFSAALEAEISPGP